jgi:glucose-6-phosphate 1-dehydrogenase
MTTLFSADFLHGQSPATAAALRVNAPSTVVIFGATGDLTGRKLVPAFLRLFAQKYLPDAISIVGVARRPFSDEAFRELMKSAVEKHAAGSADATAAWDAFAAHVHYQQVEFDDPAGYRVLAERLASRPNAARPGKGCSTWPPRRSSFCPSSTASTRRG